MNGNGPLNLTDILQALEQVVASGPLNGLPRLMGDLEYLRASAELRMKNGTPQPCGPPGPGETRYLTANEAAERFHVPLRWLYRHKHQMPHSQPSRKILLFPEGAITKWFATRHVS